MYRTKRVIIILFAAVLLLASCFSCGKEEEKPKLPDTPALFYGGALYISDELDPVDTLPEGYVSTAKIASESPDDEFPDAELEGRFIAKDTELFADNEHPGAVYILLETGYHRYLRVLAQ